MKKNSSIIFLAILVVGIIVTPFVFASFKTQPVKSYQEEKKTITVGDTEVLVTIADNDAKRSQGLSGVESLPENEGKLFIFESQNIRPIFWMREMYIALDMIWINDGKITQIHHDVPPPPPGTPENQLKLYAPDGPIDYILEVNAGFSKSHNITVGTAVDLTNIQ